MSASCYTAVSIKGQWKSSVSKHQVAVSFAGRGGGSVRGAFAVIAALPELYLP